MKNHFFIFYFDSAEKMKMKVLNISGDGRNEKKNKSIFISKREREREEESNTVRIDQIDFSSPAHGFVHLIRLRYFSFNEGGKFCAFPQYARYL